MGENSVIQRFGFEIRINDDVDSIKPQRMEVLRRSQGNFIRKALAEAYPHPLFVQVVNQQFRLNKKGDLWIYSEILIIAHMSRGAIKPGEHVYVQSGIGSDVSFNLLPTEYPSIAEVLPIVPVNAHP